MPSTTRLLGKHMRIKVGSTDTGPFTLVKSMNAFDKTGAATTTDVEVFDEDDAETIPGSNTWRLSLRGFVVPADAGQQLLRDAYAAKTIVYVQVLPEGGSAVAADNVQGYVQPARVSNVTHGASGTGASQQAGGFDLVGAGAAVTSGTGGYIL